MIDSSLASPALSGIDMPAQPHEPAFEMVVLGCGGGPLETNCSGYIVKPAACSWEDGVLSLEGGSGIGALTQLIAMYGAETMFPSVVFPETHNTPVLRAAYIFSFLSCYIITHAHLDHAASLIMLSGSVPPRPRPRSLATNSTHAVVTPTRIPVYARRETLEALALAYGGGLWPELGAWATERDPMSFARKRKRLNPADVVGVGPMFSTLAPTPHYVQLDPLLPITHRIFPVSHGHTSHGNYPSSAVFVRYDPSVLLSAPSSRRPSAASITTAFTLPADEIVNPDGLGGSAVGKEFLFFGDVESSWRAPGEEDIDKQAGEQADMFNRAIWEQAAESWAEGRLSGIFIECSYDSSRPAQLMFGHLSPPGILHELKVLASLLPEGPRPLDGLRVYITHIKEFLVPHPTGKTGKELVSAELRALEMEHGLGVEFVVPSPGDRILI